jgi:hypothetical protein
MDLVQLLTVIQSVGLSKPDFSESQLMSISRQQFDFYIFDILRKQYGPALQAFWHAYQIPLESDKAVVIVERRAHPNLQWCIQNAMYFCRGYALHIFCSHANLAFVKYILGPQVDNVHIHVEFQGIGTPAQGYEDYNQLLQTKEFWESFPEEHIITLETDSYFLKPLPESIYEFDYVASLWPWLKDEPGGGGLSYRKRSIMLQICDAFPPQPGCAQDAFAGHGIRAFGFKVPTIEKGFSYFTESVCSPYAVGTHQWWSYLVNEKNTSMDDIIHKCMLYLTLPIS